MDVALHRAFDVCRNPLETMEDAISLGIKTILTSGQKNSAWDGRMLLKELQEKSNNRIEILAGAGIDTDTIVKLYKETGITSYHLSGKIKMNFAILRFPWDFRDLASMKSGRHPKKM